MAVAGSKKNDREGLWLQVLQKHGGDLSDEVQFITSVVLEIEYCMEQLFVMLNETCKFLTGAEAGEAQNYV